MHFYIDAPRTVPSRVGEIAPLVIVEEEYFETVEKDGLVATMLRAAQSR